MKLLARLLVILIGCGLAGCAQPPEKGASGGTASSSGAVDPPAAAARSWWQGLEALCGRSFSGSLVSSDPADEDLAAQAMVMHVRRCEPDRLEIPFHIGTDRSRTWVLTRSESGVQLQHDHRHEDGHKDVVTLYGGRTQDAGSTTIQSFPVDDYSKELFAANGLEASMVNTWSMELIPGERFSYVLRRPGRHFQADFDLSTEVVTPPAPWGHE